MIERNKDGLTDAEFNEGESLCRTLIARDGIAEFTGSCLMFAQKRTLGRKQLEALRRAVKQPKRPRRSKFGRW